MDRPKNETGHKDFSEYRLTGQEPLEPDKYEAFLDKLTNLPDCQPLHRVPIDEAGITHQQVIVHINNIYGGERVVPVPCDVTLAVSLDENRGVHMSRYETAIFDAASKTFSSLDDFSAELARVARTGQHSKTGIANVRGAYLMQRPTRKTGLTSYDRISLFSDTVDTEDRIKQTTGVQAHNMTACPCTLTHTKFSVVPKLKELGFTTDQIQQILDVTLAGTHTQRGAISLTMDKRTDDINAGSLYEVLDETTHLVYEILKRADEHELVIRALRHPQFTEDVVRDVAVGVFKRFGSTVPGDTGLIIESELLESIHIHDVRTVIRTTIGKIRHALSGI